MRNIIVIVFTFISTSIMAQNGKAKTEEKTFSRTTSISQTIEASPETIWSILTNASDYPKWNSTIVSLKGDIKEGEKIQLKSTLDTSRTFKLKVKELVANEKLVWGDALGKRTYTLTKQGSSTLFTMTEKIGGPIFPLFASKIPSFDTSFEQFVADLKAAAEAKN